ncbi:MAG: hypothetical protein JXN10_01140, partial [Clostridia bacterium]|nr:hypothetical protein [Clostridia bacterium]
MGKARVYEGDSLRHIAFPLGGIGAGMICIQGSGMLGNFSIENSPDIHLEPNVFSAICIKGVGKNNARVIEGQVPYHKIFGHPVIGGNGHNGTGNGLEGKNYGLPRFRKNNFSSRFPFAMIDLQDETMPVDVSIKAWSPFIPLDADSSSLPVAILEYTFKNTRKSRIDAVYSFNALNFLVPDKTREISDGIITRVIPSQNGFTIHRSGDSCEAGASWFMVTSEDAHVNTDWYEGGWFDKLTMRWKDIESGNFSDRKDESDSSPGGSLEIPFYLEPGESRTVVLKIAWYTPGSAVRKGSDEGEGCCCSGTHSPWYSGRFSSVGELMEYLDMNLEDLRKRTERFTDSIYRSTWPTEVMEAVTANLSILKSPTILRQRDGRLWAWEGCCDTAGCCYGSCTHVWNYAQAICHLFPELERTFRKTEFNESQNEDGHQAFRSSIPIRPAIHNFHAASDGQLGGIMKLYREWRISGDTEWMASYWSKAVKSLDYCIRTWDPRREGVLKEPHHNTYDIEFWGADGMCSSFYLGALKAIVEMGSALGQDVYEYEKLLEDGRKYIENKLFNGEYFFQQTEWESLDAEFNPTKENRHCRQLMEEEGPKYQYGDGCLSDGVLGAWMASVCGLGEIIDHEKIKSHIVSVWKYNFRDTLLDHVNPQRPGYALGNEGGLLLCTWPRGNKPSLPFPYCNEVWTGFEYQVASHLMTFGEIDKALDIVRTARARHDGIKRNPYDEYECGHWYARALSSYSLIQGYTGIRYDAVEKKLFIEHEHDNLISFLSTAQGYGLVHIQDGETTFENIEGTVEINEIITTVTASTNHPKDD